jgi:fimbrial chaperone protein
MRLQSLCRLRGAASFLAAVLGFVAFGTCFGGGSVAVAPTRLELSNTSRSTTLLIQNLSDDAMDFDVEVWEWTQTSNGESLLTPTDRVRIFPLLLSVRAGEYGQIRVGLAGAPERVAEFYRVIVTERPPVPAPAEEGGGVGVILKQSIPVFVRPRSGAAEPELSFSPPTISDGAVEVTLSNVGRWFSFVRKIEVTAMAGNTELFTRSIDGWYLLPGASRVDRFELPSELCLAITELVFRATAETLTLTRTFPRPDGGCPAEAHSPEAHSVDAPRVVFPPPPEPERLPGTMQPDAPSATKTSTFSVNATIVSTAPSPSEISPPGGIPMLASRVSDTQITITQFQGAGSCANQSSFYSGPLTPADLSSYHWTGHVCALGAVAPLTVNVAAGNIFFVLVGADSAHGADGSYGKNSAGVERPPLVAGACASQVLGTTCP